MHPKIIEEPKENTMAGMQQDSNANVGRNTSDPSGMQHPNEDGGPRNHVKMRA